MVILRKYFPEIIPDNEEVYLAHLEGIIDSVDELSSMQVSRINNKYHFRISPSIPKYISLILEELFKYHTMLGIKMTMSKSIKTSTNITFEIEWNI